MPPVNNERRPNYTGTIPKTKVRNNCNVPQEAVTPTRRDMTANIVSTSLDWVPVSEYNSTTNYNQHRKPANNISEHDFSDLDNTVSFDHSYGRFVQVRPLQLTVQNRDPISSDHNNDSGPSIDTGYSLHPYSHPANNGLTPHSNHGPAAVMIVNPTAINAVPGNLSQPFNASSSENRNNLTRSLNSSRNHFEGCSNTNAINNNPNQSLSSSRMPNKSVNLMNNMYEPHQASSSNLNENENHRGSARALGEALLTACPDPVAVERRLGQIREYIRVTSSLVDTMRNSEDEAFIEHTKEEYDEIIGMVMKLKESESKLEKILVENPDNQEVLPTEEDVIIMQEIVEQTTAATTKSEPVIISEIPSITTDNVEESNPSNDVIKQENVTALNEPLAKKVTNMENEILNQNNGYNITAIEDIKTVISDNDNVESNSVNSQVLANLAETKDVESTNSSEKEIITTKDVEQNHADELKEILRLNILSCTEKLSLIEDYKVKKVEPTNNDIQELSNRPQSVQSNTSAYSENELWQNAIKNKLEASQHHYEAYQHHHKQLLKYQAQAKQELEELNRVRQTQEFQLSTSHDNLGPGNFHQSNRMHPANQVGVAVVNSLTHSGDINHHQGMMQQAASGGSMVSSNADHSELLPHQDEARTANESVGRAATRDSDVDADEVFLGERGEELTRKLRELQQKKQHMENLLSEFQKIQLMSQMGHNTYSSSDDSGEEESGQKCNKSIKNEDPFKMMEIKAIKAALQKTKDLMRSANPSHEAEHSMPERQEDNFHLPSHSNINDNKSEASGSGWSQEACRVHNCLPPRHKMTNEHHSQQQIGPENDIASLQELTHQLRMETEKIEDERSRLREAMAKKEMVRKQKKVNEDVRRSAPGPVERRQIELRAVLADKQKQLEALLQKEVTKSAPSPVERRQMELRAVLADKQMQLEALLQKEKTLCGPPEAQKVKPESRAASIANESYNSEQEGPDSELLADVQNVIENNSFRGSGEHIFSERTMNSIPAHLASIYASDSDSASRSKCNQRQRGRRKPPQERHFDDNNVQQANVRHEPRIETPTTNIASPIAQNEGHLTNGPYNQMPPPGWNNPKTNQDNRSNQFTQNNHSQTMERLLSSPQLPYPPSMPYNMMPYGVMGNCGCGVWGAWCWQQLLLQQREIQQLREQMAHLEERWRSESASHTLNNQVPPGNRANNYWDNFRSYSRQNLLSSNSKTNADGHLGAIPAHIPHPLVERSHNTLRPRLSPQHQPKRNLNPVDRPNLTDRQNLADRYNLDISPNCNRKISTKNAPTLDYSHVSNINIASEFHAPNPNLASTSQSNTPNPNLASTSRDKSASKLFDLVRDNVYSEVTALIGVNESHPDFLIQLFRELQLISSEPLRQRVLQAIQTIITQYPTVTENEPSIEVTPENIEPVPSTSRENHFASPVEPPLPDEMMVIRFIISKAEEVCTLDFINALASQILGDCPTECCKRGMIGILSKYEGAMIGDVSNKIIDQLPVLMTLSRDCSGGRSPPLQDVAGSLLRVQSPGLPCAYHLWTEDEAASAQPPTPSDAVFDDKAEDTEHNEMMNGELAEADQSCRAENDNALTEAEAEWLGLDRVPTRLHIEQSSENQKD